MTANLSKLNEFMKNGNYAKAEFYLYEFLKEKPNDYTLNKNLGMTLLAQKKYDGALKSFEKCYFINKGDFDIILNLSFLFLKVQDHEQSIKFACKAYVFEPNVKSTWVSVKAMISNFLINMWKQGALAGAVPADAFSVQIGLGTTMTAEDILEGKMIVEVKVAISRPAEFIVISFEQEMQKS